MHDQAESLRKLVSSYESLANDTKVVSVVSGKGGVGKSNFSVNFAIALRQAGKRVLLMDLDIGMANADILMGISTRYNIVDMIENQLSIWDIIEKGPGGIAFISGGTGFSKVFQLNERKFNRFVEQLEKLNGGYDYIIFDMGAGVNENSLKFILSSNESIIITTPEPTAITDAYAMLKYLLQLKKDIECKILINRTDSKKEAIKTGENFKRVARRFLDKEVAFLGYLPNDKLVLKAVKRQVPFILLEPKGRISKNLQEIARLYLQETKKSEQPMFRSFINNFKKLFKER